MVRRSPDVRANGVPDEGLGVPPEGRGKQRLDGGADPIDDGAEVGRLMRRGLAKLLQRGHNRSALRVPKHNRQPRAEAPGGKLYTPDLRRRHDIPRYPNHEQVSEPLPENELCGNARVGTAQHDGKGRLAAGEGEPMRLVERDIGGILARDKATVALSQPRECFVT